MHTKLLCTSKNIRRVSHFEETISGYVVGRVWGYTITVEQGKNAHEAILIEDCNDDPQQFLSSHIGDVKIRWKVAGYNDEVNVNSITLQSIHDGTNEPRKAAAAASEKISTSASKKRNTNEYSAIATADNSGTDNAKPSTVTSGIGIKQEQESTDDENNMKPSAASAVTSGVKTEDVDTDREDDMKLETVTSTATVKSEDGYDTDEIDTKPDALMSSGIAVKTEGVDVIKSMEFGRWTNNDGESYLFSATLKDESQNYGSTAQSVHVKLLHETTSSQHTQQHQHDNNKKMKQTEEVGYLAGYLISRPSSDFFDVCDAITSELQELSVYFCQSDGQATRCNNPKLREDSPLAVSRGGFFNIEMVEVKPEYQGNDYGLIMIHEALFFLENRWTLAVMMPGSSNFPKWKDGRARKGNTGSNKLGVYFTRMGFVQASSTRNGCGYCFLTHELYYNHGWISRTRASANEAKSQWISKEDSVQIKLYSPPELSHHLQGKNQELSLAIQRNNLGRVDKLIQEGASINNTHGLHIAVVNAERISPTILPKLILMGGDVNHSGLDGYTHLHEAGVRYNTRDIKVLIAAGADISARTDEGQTAIDLIRSQCHETGDSPICRSICTSVRESDVIPPYETIVALMTSDEKGKLVDRWMPPKLFYLMKYHAEAEIDDLLELIGGYSPRLAFIPENVLKNYPNGQLYPCLEALRFCFQKICEIMESGRSPTVERIVDRLQSRPIYENFVSKGGKVEHALDLLLYAAKYEGEDILEEHPQQESSHLGGMFELARYMLINRGGGSWSGWRGPYDGTRQLLCNINGY